MSIFIKLLIWLIAIPIIHVLYTVIHELGHAIPALLFTKKKVIINLDRNFLWGKSVNFSIGLLEFNVNASLFITGGGNCVIQLFRISRIKQIIILVSGPLVSLLSVFIAAYFSNRFEFQGITLHITYCFMIFSFLGFLNLIPFKFFFWKDRDNTQYSDGLRIKLLLQNDTSNDGYRFAYHLAENHKYHEAVDKVQELIDKGQNEPHILSLHLSLLYILTEYDEAISKYSKRVLDENSNDHDLNILGSCYMSISKYKIALKCFYKALQINPENKFALNNKGFVLNEKGKFKEAITVLNRAIEIDENFGLAYCNRGLSKIKTGQSVEGLKDLEHSNTLSKKNPYYFRNKGIYYFEKNQPKIALDLFRKAVEISADTLRIKELFFMALRKDTRMNPSKGLEF